MPGEVADGSEEAALRAERGEMTQRESGFSALVCCLAALVATAATVGCGYRPVHGGGASRFGSVSVPAARNLTARADVAADLTAALRRRAAASGVRVEASGTPRLEVTILDLEDSPGAVTLASGRLAPAELVWRLVAEAAVVGAGGEVLRGPERFEVDGFSRYGDGPRAAEALAARSHAEMIDTLAERVVERLLGP